jgi:hypothetical protein
MWGEQIFPSLPFLASQLQLPISKMIHLVRSSSFEISNGVNASAYPDSTTAITFLAQWHPLIEPKRNTFRPGYEQE